MGRGSKHRKRLRKARREAKKAEDAWYEERGLVLPRNRNTERRDGTRWANLSARGGLKMSFTGSGKRIPVDFDDPAAEHALALSVVPEAQGDN